MQWIITVILTMKIIPKEHALIYQFFHFISYPTRASKKGRRNEKKEEEEDQYEEEKEGEELPSHLNLIWDEEEFGDDENDDIME